MIRGGLVYILTNKSNKVLYIGVTSDIAHRIWQHKSHIYQNSFTAKYNCEKLVYIVFIQLLKRQSSKKNVLKAEAD